MNVTRDYQMAKAWMKVIQEYEGNKKTKITPVLDTASFHL